MQIPAETAVVHAPKSRAHSSAGERSLHTGEVQGSIPCAPTRIFNEKQAGVAIAGPAKNVAMYRSQRSGRRRFATRRKALLMRSLARDGFSTNCPKRPHSKSSSETSSDSLAA